MAPVGRNCLTCVVRETDCFCSLPTHALVDLQAVGRHLRFATGEMLQNEGFSADRVYVVCQGRIKLTASSPDGRLLLVRIAGPGDVLGLAAALRGTSHTLSAETLEPCEVKVMGRVEFLEFTERFREVSRNMVKSVAAEYEGVLLSARRLGLSGSAAAKLASVLLEWGRMGNATGKDAMTFRMPLTHAELGSMAGLTRETVTRVLAKFRKEDLLRQTGEQMVVPDPEKLERLYC